MTTPPPPSNILNTQISLIRTFADFLTVSIHTILYVRSLYPQRTFITTRKYNFPVHQNRHPRVCQWINNAVSSVRELMFKNKVRRVAVVIYNKKSEVMERYLFDVERFPVVERESVWVEFEDRDAEGKEGKDPEDIESTSDEPSLLSIVDIEEQLRATICRLDYEGSRKSPLPENCTYTLAVELKDDPALMPPIGHPQPWIPSMPRLQPGARGDSRTIGADLGGARSTPVRLVESGEFVLETWIEEGKAKFA